MTTGNINQVYSGKKTWKRIAVKKETSADKAVAGLDIGEKRKSANLGGKEDHSVEGEKRKKIEVCLTTPTVEVAQQPRRAVAGLDIIVFLMETKLKKDWLDLIKEKCKMKNCFVVPSIGSNGGLILLWKEELKLDIKTFSQNHIDA